MKEYVFDTNAFNRLLDDETNIQDIGDDILIYGSHIQMEELAATKNIKRRDALLKAFHVTTDKLLKTESMVFPIKFGSTKFGDGTYERLRSELDTEANKLKNKKNKLKNNPNDAQIGEIAIKNNYILVTDDTELLKVIKSNNSRVLTYDEFKLDFGQLSGKKNA